MPDSFTYTGTVSLTPWRRTIERVEWSVRRAGYELPDVSWYFHHGIKCVDNMGEVQHLEGVCHQTDEGADIHIDVSHPVDLTMLHELAHAVLWEIEHEPTVDAHGPVFLAMYRSLSAAYWSDEGPHWKDISDD